jgi:erythromycin esterase
MLLTACGGGSGQTQANQPTKPDNASLGIVVDLTQAKLLSDSEMQTSAVSNLSPPTAEEKLWLQNNHKKIRSLTYDKDFTDLAFLDQTLVGKRIVQLGESSHGTREFSQVKVRLIKYLHEKLGYDVIAFESSTIGCYMQDLEYAKGKTYSVRESCIFGVWSSKETQELFDYLVLTRKTTRPLRLAGFDVQISNGFDNSEVVLPWLAPILRSSDSITFSNAEGIIGEALKIASSGTSCFSNPSGDLCLSFHKNYLGAAANIGMLANSYKPYAEASTGAERETKMMAWLMLSNLQARLLVTKGQIDNRGYREPRDKAMAENMNQLASAIYPSQKIMVWAHNSHVTRGASDAAPAGHTMGGFLAPIWKDQLYSIGLFMLKGETADNNGSVLKVAPPSNDSLESYSASLQLGAFFLATPSIDQAGGGDDWLHRIIGSYYWGGQTVIRERLDNQFDAVIVIDHSSMPEYLK